MASDQENIDFSVFELFAKKAAIHIDTQTEIIKRLDSRDADNKEFLKRLDKRIDQTDKRIEQVDIRIVHNERFINNLDKQLVELRTSFSDFKEFVKFRFDSVDEKFGAIDKKFEDMDKRFDKIGSLVRWTIVTTILGLSALAAFLKL